jgi:DNA-binding CsgD family transcriptional regulator
LKTDFEDWVRASAGVLAAVGRQRFSAALAEAMRCVVPFEFTVTFAYCKDSRPIDVHDDFPETKRKVMVDDYQEGPYLLDPFYLNSVAPTESRLVRLRDLAPDRFYQGEYFRNYYKQTGLAEEIGFIIGVGEDVSVVISAMREHKAFSAREFRDLQAIFPFVETAARQHWTGLEKEFSVRPDADGKPLAQLIEESFQRFGRNLLTPRETEIVEFTLKGHSAEATGRALGIASGTVRIHRRNIYGKLGVNSQGELFSKFISSIEEY